MLRRFAAPALLLALGAACAQPAPETAALPDTTAVRAALETIATQYETALVAGDAAGLAAVFVEDGHEALYGSPTAAGRATIQANAAAAFGAVRYETADIVTGPVAVHAPTVVTAGGTATFTMADPAGARNTGWFRWAAAYRLGGDRTWRIEYLIAFPDSITPLR